MLVLVPEEQEAGDHTQGPSMYFETGDLSTLEYLYDLRWMRASSEMQSMVSFSACEGGRSAVCSGGGAKCHCDDALGQSALAISTYSDRRPCCLLQLRMKDRDGTEGVWPCLT